MKKNIGKADRIIRVIVSSIIGILYFTGAISGVFGIALLILAGIIVLIGIINFCPLYTVFGISTRTLKGRKKTKDELQNS